MNELREKYFGLTQPQRAMITVAAVLVIALIEYFYLLSPQLKANEVAKADLKRANETSATMNAQLIKLKKLGNSESSLDAEQIQALKLNGNEVIFSSQMTEFLNTLRELNEQVGGTHYRLQEKPSESAHTSLGQRGDVYDLMRLPVIITFNADYATAANFLFQLRSMRRMLRIEDTKFISEIYTGNLTVLVKMDIYFVEEP